MVNLKDRSTLALGKVMTSWLRMECVIRDGSAHIPYTSRDTMKACNFFN